MKTTLFIIAAASLTVFANPAAASGYELNHTSIGPSTATPDSPSYHASTTFGNSPNASMYSTSYRLTPANAALPFAIQTPSAPRLTITAVPEGFRVAWSPSTQRYALQLTSAIGTAANWKTIETPPQSEGEEQFIIISKRRSESTFVSSRWIRPTSADDG